MKKIIAFTVAVAIITASFCAAAAKTDASVAAFAKNEPKGSIIVFDESDFEVSARAGNTLDAILITDIPASGILAVDDRAVASGEIVSMSDVSRMTYVASAQEEDVLDSLSFKPVFSKTGTSDEDVRVTLSISDKPNNTPVAVNAEYKTYTDISLCGTLKAVDTDGDECRFEITDSPKKGDVTLDGSEFVYTPKAGKTGKDSFEFVAVDSRGNTSAAATVSIQICKPASKDSFSYCDMLDSPAHYSALYLREEGIMSGETFGGQSFFYPDETISRAQFVTLVSEIAGLAVPTVSVGTGLADNDAIPTWARPYVAAAISCGVISGESGDDGNKVFRANDPITRAEAASILDRAMKLAEDGREICFGDMEEIPAWAEQSIVNTTAAGILNVFNDNTVRASEYVTREDAALMLHNAVCYVKQKTEKTGLLAGLFD